VCSHLLLLKLLKTLDRLYRNERYSGEGYRVIGDIYFPRLHSTIIQTGYLGTTALLPKSNSNQWVLAVAFSPDGHRLAAGGVNALVQLRDIGDLQQDGGRTGYERTRRRACDHAAGVGKTIHRTSDSRKSSASLSNRANPRNSPSRYCGNPPHLNRNNILRNGKGPVAKEILPDNSRSHEINLNSS
jgi:hypothetical protein